MDVVFIMWHLGNVFSQKPKIEWMKNQMIIGDDPKYRQICVQGICSLEIRKPGNFDGGVYSCRAKNDHGETIVSCKLEIRRTSFALKP